MAPLRAPVTFRGEPKKSDHFYSTTPLNYMCRKVETVDKWVSLVWVPLPMWTSFCLHPHKITSFDNICCGHICPLFMTALRHESKHRWVLLPNKRIPAWEQYHIQTFMIALSLGLNYLLLSSAELLSLCHSYIESIARCLTHSSR